MSKERQECCCCTRIGMEYYKINGFDYCPGCFAEMERHFVTREVPLIAEVEPRCFRMNELCSGPPSEVMDFGYYTIEDKGRKADPTFYYCVHGKGPKFQFSMKSIPEELREWLARIIRRQLYVAYRHGREEKAREVQSCAEKMMAVLGLGD